MTLDEELEQVIGCYKPFEKRIEEERCFRECLKEWTEGKAVVAIAGNPVVVNNILQYMYKPEKIKYVLGTELEDSPFAAVNPEMLKGIEFLDIKDVDKCPANVILVAIDGYNREVFNYIYKPNKKYKIINVFDFLRMNNSYYLIDVIKDNTYTHHENLMLFRKKYELEISKENKENYLLELIFYLLKVKDFQFALKYMDEYIERDFLNKKTIEEMIKKLKAFLLNIKQSLKNRNQKDILLIWNDGLRNDELHKMNFLGKTADKSLCINNVHTTVYDTEWTGNAIYNKKLQLDDFDAQGKLMNNKNTSLIKKLKEYGYNFKTIARKKYTESEFCVLSKDVYVCSTERWWDAIKVILNSPQKIFVTIHCVSETHNPYHSILLDKDVYFNRECTVKEYGNQLDISRTYWDMQLEFYTELFDYDNIKIYMSDHGKPTSLEDLCNLKWTFDEEYIHTCMVINGVNIPAAQCNKIFSLYNFQELIDYSINPTIENFQRMFPNDYILIQSFDRYNKGDIERKLADGTDKRCMMAFRGVVTQEDKYILLANGEEFYFRMPDEKNNYINEPEFSHRIAELKKIAGDKFLDIKNIEKFKYSNMLY